jgi:prepilin-type N-terminal cleavage/methylation domain-containing protein
MTRSGHPAAHATRAFTLVEVMISIVILATLLAGMLYTFGGVARQKQVFGSSRAARNVADNLLNEILQNPYVDATGATTLGPDAGETTGTRAAFNDVDDYHGWTATPPRTKDGTPIPGLTGWRESVAVEYINPDTLVAGGSTDTGLKRVSVTVTSPTGRSATAVVLRGSAGPYDQNPPVNPVTYTSWVGIRLQVGDTNSPIAYAGAATLNLVPKD